MGLVSFCAMSRISTPFEIRASGLFLFSCIFCRTWNYTTFSVRVHWCKWDGFLSCYAYRATGRRVCVCGGGHMCNVVRHLAFYVVSSSLAASSKQEKENGDLRTNTLQIHVRSVQCSFKQWAVSMSSEQWAGAATKNKERRKRKHETGRGVGAYTVFCMLQLQLQS